MFRKIITGIFGSRNERVVRQLRKIVNQINALEPGIQGLADADFPEKTRQLKQKVANGTTLDELLPEAFALVRKRASVPWVCGISTSS